MTQVELSFDGWCRRHVGNVLLRKNYDHIQRSITAIQLRRENEETIRIEPEKSKVIQLRKRVDKTR